MSNFADVPLERQQARCLLTAILMGKSLLILPDDFEGTKKDCEALARVSKWHEKVIDECSKKKLPLNLGISLRQKEKKFHKLVGLNKKMDKETLDRRKVAAFWASVVLLWDVRVTCPAFGRTAAWRYLDLASDKLGRSLLDAYKGAVEIADNIYLEIAW